MKILKTREQVLDVIRGGRMFTVTFINSDGSIRKMNGQFGNKTIQKGKTGNGRAKLNYDREQNTITMSEFGAFSETGKHKRFRVDRLISVKANGQLYGGCRYEEMKGKL